MNKEMKIVPPEGYEIDTENSTFECIKFKKIEKSLPKTWEEFCELTPIKNGESFFDESSKVFTLCKVNKFNNKRHEDINKNLLPNKETAEAMLALCQLIQLRDCYNDGWTPDWKNYEEDKWVIYVYESAVMSSMSSVFNSHQKILAFRTAELRNNFHKNFRDLIEIAKPLL